MTTTIVPSGCRWCGIEERRHGGRWHPSVGRHGHQPPTATQILTRMRQRRRERVAAEAARRRWPLGERVYWALIMLPVTPVVAAFLGYAITLAAGRWS